MHQKCIDNANCQREMVLNSLFFKDSSQELVEQNPFEDGLFYNL